MQIERLSPHIGATIEGIELSSAMNEDLVTKIRAALLEHMVIIFRQQDLSPAELVGIAKRFGALSIYPFVRGMDAHPEIVEVVKHAHEKVNFGGLWHSDTTYLEEPPLGSLLYAKEIPPVGGDTLFANVAAAYDALSEGLKATLLNLRAVNSAENPDAAKTRVPRIESRGQTSNISTTAVHPVVRTHPETGRKALYVNGGHTVSFEGMTAEESAPLLNYIYTVQQRPEFSCRHRWQAGDLAFWDNRAAQHNALNDYHGHRRVMWRVTLAGDSPK